MRTVLLVEDEEQARGYVRKVLEKLNAGFVVAGEAGNGGEALELLRNLKPDLVIADIVMPVMDGVELLRTARREGFDGRFLMLTCMSDFEYARQALEYGASGYLLKLSLDPETLRDNLIRIESELSGRDRLKKLDRVWSGITGNQPDQGFTGHPVIDKIIAYMKEHYAEELSLKRLSEFASMESSYLSDLFKKKTGSTLTHYQQRLRIEAASILLRESGLSVTEIGERVGFAGDSYFIRIFKRWTGHTPSDFRRQP
ncbi:MAG: two component transcriptional regulator, AraC family protein [Paenibacillaceae bacterium]|jgi:YesN/AraC family two-component response regulator|nr:two component transcriptional regulator, AraC family protein [Paenibacillaceae bacterium]